MTKVCDHTSVGMLVWKDEKLLLIERARAPFGFALPAGHVDDDSSFEEAARRELLEEVGLQTEHLELLLEGRKENACRRTDGTWHYWKLYLVTPVAGGIDRSADETKQAGWYTKECIEELALRTQQYNKKEISEEVWSQNPGLEPVMFDWFVALKIL